MVMVNKIENNGESFPCEMNPLQILQPANLKHSSVLLALGLQRLGCVLQCHIKMRTSTPLLACSREG